MMGILKRDRPGLILEFNAVRYRDPASFRWLRRQPANLPADLQLLEQRCRDRATQPDAEGGTAAQLAGDPQSRQ